MSTAERSDPPGCGDSYPTIAEVQRRRERQWHATFAARDEQESIREAERSPYVYNLPKAGKGGS